MVNLPPSLTIREAVNKYSTLASKVTSAVISPSKFSEEAAAAVSKPLVQPAVQAGAAAPLPAPVATPSVIKF